MSTASRAAAQVKPWSISPVATYGTPGLGRVVQVAEPGAEVLRRAAARPAAAPGPWPSVTSTTRHWSASQRRTSARARRGIAPVRLRGARPHAERLTAAPVPTVHGAGLCPGAVAAYRVRAARTG